MRYEDPNIARKNALQRDHLDAAPRLPGGEPMFAHVEFDVCGACNRACSFCPRGDPAVYPSVNEFMDPALYRRIVVDLAAVDFSGRLSFCGFSEPLLHKGVPDMVTFTKDSLPGASIEIITNGDPLRPKLLKRLHQARLDRLLVSLYDGEHQIARFHEMAAEAGVPAEWLLLRKRYLPPEESFGINLTSRTGYATGLKHMGVVARAEPMEHPCYYPHYRMMVDHLGQVLLCPHDWGKKLVVGRLSEENILDVWRGPRLSNARKRLAAGDRRFAPCDVCDVEGTLQGREHAEAWAELERR